MATNVPVLNDYKKNFVFHRLAQTFLAGVRLTDAGCGVAVVHLALFLLPAILALPYAILEHSMAALSSLYCGLAYAATIFLLALVLQWTAFILAKKRSGFMGGPAATGSVYQSEDGQGAGAVAAGPVLKRRPLNRIVHPFVAALCAGSAYLSLSPDLVSGHLFPYPVHGMLVVAFGIFTASQAVFSVMVAAPPETAAFRALDHWELDQLSRPAHFILITGLQLLLSLADACTDQHGGPEVGLVLWIRRTCYFLVCAMPALWLAGALPPLEPMILWLMEQIQIFLFGGSPARHPVALGFSFIWSLVSLAVVCVSSRWLDPACLVLEVALMGFISSLDIFAFVQHIVNLRPSLSGRVHPEHADGAALTTSSRSAAQWPGSGAPDLKPHRASEPSSCWILRPPVAEAALHALLFSLTCVLAWPQFPATGSWQQLNQTANVSFTAGTAARSSSLQCLGWATASFYLLLVASQELQKVFLLCGLIRSPIYGRKGNILSLVSSHISKILRQVVLRPYMVLYLRCLISEDSGQGVWPSGLEAAALMRSFRWIWQNTDSALLDMSVAHVVSVAADTKWLTESTPQLLLLISFACDRMRQMADKVYLVAALSLSSVEDRVSRRPYAGCLFQMNLLLMPVILAMIVISSVISSPLVALFTLPIFLVGYPRPSLFWPVSESCWLDRCAGDAMYYEQMMPHLVEALHHATGAGHMAVSAGCHLLARHEDRTVWIRILEQGNGYTYYSAKGLELQETSCHSLEVTRIDDMFRETFERPHSLVNRFVLDSVTPLCQLPVLSYSASKTILTGIMDNMPFLIRVQEILTQNITWLLVRELVAATAQRQSGSGDHGEGKAWGHQHSEAACQGEPRPPASLIKRRGLLPPLADPHIHPGKTCAWSTHDSHREYLQPELWSDFISQFSGTVRLLKTFSWQWLAHCLHRFLMLDGWQEQEVRAVLQDEGLLTQMATMTTCLSRLIYPIDEDRRGTVMLDETLGVGQLIQVFHGHLPWSLQNEWAKANAPHLLSQTLLPAFRMAVKRTLDEVLVAPELSFPEMDANIRELVHNWHLGPDDAGEWQEAVRQHTPNLFSIVSVESGGRSCRKLVRSHLLSLRSCPVSVGRLNPEVVKAIWANLSLELLYLTNDDDERYSIQAEERLLRNLTVEAAEVPLGYPIYSMPFTRRPLH